MPRNRTLEFIDSDGIKKHKRVVANVAFVNVRTGKILLHKRVKEKYEGTEYWSFFGGRADLLDSGDGEIEFEPPINAAKREIQEELGIILRDQHIFTNFCTISEKVEDTNEGKKIEQIERHVYIVLTDKDEPFFETKEQKKVKVKKRKGTSGKGQRSSVVGQEVYLEEKAVFHSFDEARNVNFRNDINPDIKTIEEIVEQIGENLNRILELFGPIWPLPDVFGTHRKQLL